MEKCMWIITIFVTDCFISVERTSDDVLQCSRKISKGVVYWVSPSLSLTHTDWQYFGRISWQMEWKKNYAADKSVNTRPEEQNHWPQKLRGMEGLLVDVLMYMYRKKQVHLEGTGGVLGPVTLPQRSAHILCTFHFAYFSWMQKW